MFTLISSFSGVGINWAYYSCVRSLKITVYDYGLILIFCRRIGFLLSFQLTQKRTDSHDQSSPGFVSLPEEGALVFQSIFLCVGAAGVPSPDVVLPERSSSNSDLNF